MKESEWGWDDRPINFDGLSLPPTLTLKLAIVVHPAYTCCLYNGNAITCRSSAYEKESIRR